MGMELIFRVPVWGWRKPRRVRKRVLLPLRIRREVFVSWVDEMRFGKWWKRGLSYLPACSTANDDFLPGCDFQTDVSKCDSSRTIPLLVSHRILIMLE